MTAVEFYDWQADPDREVVTEPETVVTDQRVDPPEPQHPRVWATVTGREQVDRRPVVPAWLRSRSDAYAGARYLLGNATHTIAYHLTRSPKYGLRVAAWAPVGLGRLLLAVGRWVADLDGRPAGDEVARRDNPDAWRRVREVHDSHVKHRLYATLAGLGLLLATGLVVWLLTPGWVPWTLLAVLLLVLARIGRPADRPLTDVAVVIPQHRKLTAQLVRAALLATGYGKKPEDFQFPREITRAGGGYTATITLPHGLTAAMIADRRDRIAGAFRLPLDQVWVRAGRHVGEVELYVLDEPIATRKQPPWPLLRAGRVDIFGPVPLGTDERGDPVKVTLMFSSLVCGAVPRSGKSVAVRLLTLAGALDPRVRLVVADLKGTGDFAALRPVAWHYIVGDDDDDLDALLAALRELHQDMRRRTRVIRDMPRDVCPDSKVTAQLASQPALGLAPVLAVIDECQVLFTDPRYGEEAERIVTDLVKRGPAVGIMTILATQKPDAKSLPTGITSNASMRLAFRLMDQQSNDQVLGTSAYRSGVRATQLTASDKGVGWLVGALDEPTVVRVHYVDGVQAEKVVARAVALRGGPTQPAEPDRGPRYDLVADVRAVWVDGQDAVWSETLVQRLAQLRPELYGGWEVGTLNAALRAAKVTVGQVHRKVDGRGVTRYGVRWTDLPDSRVRAIDSAPASAEPGQ